MDDNEEYVLTDEQITELRRRLDECERNPDDSVSWEEVKARLLRPFKDEELQLADEEKAELARRLAECETKPDARISWEQLRAELKTERDDES